MLDSTYQPLCAVNLPYQGRQEYMHAFDLANPVMKEGFEDYLDPVTILIRAAKAFSGRAFMTVDEKIVRQGSTQRRPGPHVDGCFMSSEMRWSHPPAWNHYCNNVPVPRMSVIVAASVAGCKVWEGLFDSEPRNDGDLSHIEDQLGNGVILWPNFGYKLSPDCVHESLVFQQDTKRTFLRIALPVI
jgi:hypothetical protein